MVNNIPKISRISTGELSRICSRGKAFPSVTISKISFGRCSRRIPSLDFRLKKFIIILGSPPNKYPKRKSSQRCKRGRKIGISIWMWYRNVRRME